MAFGHQKGPIQKIEEKQSCSPSPQKYCFFCYFNHPIYDLRKLCGLWPQNVPIQKIEEKQSCSPSPHKDFLKVLLRSELIWLKYCWSKKALWSLATKKSQYINWRIKLFTSPYEDFLKVFCRSELIWLRYCRSKNVYLFVCLFVRLFVCFYILIISGLPPKDFLKVL